MQLYTENIQKNTAATNGASSLKQLSIMDINSRLMTHWKIAKLLFMCIIKCEKRDLSESKSYKEVDLNNKKE